MTKVEELAQDLAVLGRAESLQVQHVILTKSLMHRMTNILRAVPGNAAELLEGSVAVFAEFLGSRRHKPSLPPPLLFHTPLLGG